jgi:hypothetical protein
MKTNKSNNQENKGNSCKELGSRSAQLSREGERETTKPGTDNRMPIDYAKRQANRQLPTDKLIALLRAEAPKFFEVAEVVGKWVWIQFTDKQPSDITARLAEFGFHWNNKRQAWQHPCGAFRKQPFNGDPRTRYGSRFVADTQVA